jgi:succinate-semialdehyde dehydrogenase / glutarate-semialdehyde dehydrogenase
MTQRDPDLQLLIDGEWLSAAHRRTIPVLNPATETLLGELPLVDSDDLDRALQASERAFALWRRSSVDERARVLKGAAALLRERVELIAAQATAEEGKTLAESRGETLGSANLFDFYAEECRRSYGRVLVRPSGLRSLVTMEPVGPIAAFAPWNFPLHNPARKLGAPIAAGCSVIMKPAEEAPASALHVARALVDAGLPPGVVQIVFGVPDEVSRHLLASPIVRQVSFTGSTVVGKHLMRLAADQAQRTTMELGGHAPVIVFDDADIDRALDVLARSKYRNAGQVCISPTRFFVHRGIYDRFVDGFVRRAREIVVGNGMEDGVQMGPMANARRIAAMESFVADARQQGAQLLLGGERAADTGYFYRPTVLGHVPETARVMNEEPFGPLALMTPFDDFDEVVARANRLPYGLAAYAFTQSARTAQLISEAFESGMVGINTTVIAGPDSPFGGVKHSGHGAEDGPEGLADCMVRKVIHQA